MKRLMRLLAITFIAPCLILSAHSQTSPQKNAVESPMMLRVDVLTDTGGVNMNSYLKNLVRDLRKHWMLLVPETAKQSAAKKEETRIVFTVVPDGNISAIAQEGSTNNAALDQAAWNAVKTTPYLPPPSGTLKLRIHFIVQ